MMLCLNVHPDRARDLEGPDEVIFNRPVRRTEYRDLFGNRCLRIMAEAGCNILELQSRSGHLTFSELQKYIIAADKRFAADRAAEKVTAHKAAPKSRRKIAA